MSVSGTIMLIAVCITYALCKDTLKAKWKRRLLFLVMAFYLLPVGVCKQQIYEWIGGKALIPLSRNRLEGRIDTSYVVARIGDERIALGNQRYLEGFILFSAIATAMIILYRLYSCHIHKKQMKKENVRPSRMNSRFYSKMPKSNCP